MSLLLISYIPYVYPLEDHDDPFNHHMPLDGPAGQGELTDQEGVGAGGELVEQRPVETEKPDIHIVKPMTWKFLLF